ncbi:prephenate dehydrogenase [Candidatus Poribacteria bacterium]|nr:prephenate dehydrogenase [Candidatus Poribacteria bacterium]
MNAGLKPPDNQKKIDRINCLTIWGVGLIGGSLGLALKNNGFKGKLVGLGRNIERLQVALDLGAVDFITTDIQEGIDDSEFIVLCTPVNIVPENVRQIAKSIQKDNKRIIITDVGSTKSSLVRTIERDLIPFCDDSIVFVGGHPMAGSHESGVKSAKSSMFEGAKCVLTPTESTDEDSLNIVSELWQYVGCDIYKCSPEIHDLLIGAASHLPHLIASLLTNTVADVNTSTNKALDFTATGFRDTTRIAAGSADLWTSIFMENSEVMISLIDNFVCNLNEIKKLLKSNDSIEIDRILSEAETTVKELI